MYNQEHGCYPSLSIVQLIPEQRRPHSHRGGSRNYTYYGLHHYSFQVCLNYPLGLCYAVRTLLVSLSFLRLTAVF
jgi:hypothetical protein